VGLAAYKEHGLSAPAAILAGLLGGLATMYLTAYLFRAAMRLANPGARFSVAKTVGSRATVYVAIPAEGRGQVQVSADGMLHTLEAVSEDRAPLDSFTSVTIVKAIDGRTVSVRKA
jgi:membrane protein implicated in regulation of membrane protease activity